MKKFFTGRATEPTNTNAIIPRLNLNAQTDPRNYLCPEALAAAVDTAILLGMPLLLTGEPGCGKSQLAYRVAWEMGFAGGKPLRYSVKSTTEAQDLFYSFDAVKRFQVAHQNDANSSAAIASYHFVRYQALGLAILRAKGLNALENQGLGRLWGKANQPPGLSAAAQRSVVLIDEIDKAPRDVPNDILNEIESLSFHIPELDLDQPLQLEEEENTQRPVIIITSNAERDLPEAFLRRCIYYHMSLPPFDAHDPLAKPGDVTVQQIIAARFQTRFSEQSPFLQSVLSFFRYLRQAERNLVKPPSLAEMLNWLDAFEKSVDTFDPARSLADLIASEDHRDWVQRLTATVLLKREEDQQQAVELLDHWQTHTAVEA